jgi:peptidoglycan/LPS O-acetylase OafA/YrhL
MQNNRNLDVLRAIAVLFVVADHFVTDILGHPRWAPGLGRCGVMIFFVHTCLVLMWSMERNEGTEAPFAFVGSFYIRRAFRIYPLSILSIGSVLLLHIPLDPLGKYQPHSTFGIVSNLLLIQNITRQINILGPLWSLPWEIQMYILLPFLYFAVQRGRVKILAAITIVIAATNLFGVLMNFKPAHMLDFFPCFMGGVFAYSFSRKAKQVLPANLWLLLIAAFALIYCRLGGWTPLRLIAFPDWLLCLILGVCVPLFRELPLSIFTNAAALIARYSYGIYIFHVPILWLSFVVAKVEFPAACLLAAVLLRVIPITTYIFLEEPMIERGKWLARQFSRRLEPHDERAILSMHT